jgi:Mn-dependent DtxR family transcriptional regulator
MLEILLRLIATGGIHSYEDLTRRLSISTPMLEAALEELSHLGYLRAVGSGCEGHCAGCSIANCSVSGPGHLWSLTDKGAKAAARLG